MMATKESNVGAALARLTVFDVWGEAPWAERPFPTRDGVYLNPFKESVKRTPSFSITKDGKRWKDFSNNLPAAGVKAFVEACHPDWGKIDVLRFLVEAAGLEWHEQLGDGRSEMEDGGAEGRAKFLREKRLKAERERRAARDAERVERERNLEWPERPGLVPALACDAWGAWLDGRDALSEDLMAQLAEKRGWPVDWVRELKADWLIGCPALPWASEKRMARGLAFAVEDYDLGALCQVGYHQLNPRHGSWLYVPYVPREPKNDFQRKLAELGRTCPALPFVLGDPASARVAIVTEGQWDAVTVFGCLDGFAGQADDVIVFGLRGVHGADVWLAHWGAWLRERMPKIWLMPDNDEQGRVWYDRGVLKRKAEVTLEERLWHANLQVSRSLVPKAAGKDFNDLYVARRKQGLAIDAAWMRGRMVRLGLETCLK